MKKHILAVSIIAAASVFGVSLFAVNNRYNYNYKITLSDAKDIVFDSLGIDEDDAFQKMFKLDDGKYEIEFVYNGIEYEYEVSAYTGQIIKSETDYSDDVYYGNHNSNHNGNHYGNQNGTQNNNILTITLDDAKKIVFNSLGITENKVTLQKCELDGGKYEIDFIYDDCEYEYEVNAYNGNIVKSEKDYCDNWYISNSQQNITLDDAKDIVFDSLGITESKVTLQKCELDDGKYEIDFIYDNCEYEYEVNVSNGTIIKSEKDYCDNWYYNNSQKNYSLESAKKIVFDLLGISESKVTMKKSEFDEGKYEIEFCYDGIEYDYEVSSINGTIIKADSEYCDDCYKNTTSTTTKTITLDDAKSIVFASLGISESQVWDKNFEYDDGKYDIEFKYGNYEYEYEVSISGDIIKADKDYDD